MARTEGVVITEPCPNCFDQGNLVHYNFREQVPEPPPLRMLLN